MSVKFTRKPIPKNYEVYQSAGVWYADFLTDISRINIYTGDDENLAVLAARRDGSRIEEFAEGCGTGYDCDGVMFR